MSDFLPDRYQEMQDEIDWLKVTLEVFVDMRREADAEIERLREALEGASSWLDTWAQHVGSCAGENACTCGLTAIRFEARAILKGN